MSWPVVENAWPNFTRAVGLNTGSHSIGVPSQRGAWYVVTCFDIFYYGGFASPEFQVRVHPSLGSDCTWWDWRPESGSDQSFHWEGFQVFAFSDQWIVGVTDGLFDWMVSGWIVPSELAPTT